MDWTDLGRKVADMGAQVLGEALPFPGSGLAADLVSEAVGAEDSKDPAKIAEAIDADPEARAKLLRIQSKRETELKRIAAQKEETRIEAGTARQDAVNETMQVGYKEGVLWRRGVGWSFIAVSLLTVIGVFSIAAYALYKGKPDLISVIPEIVAALAVIFYAYMVILGVAGYQDGKLGRLLAGESEGGATKLIKAIRGMQ